MRVASIGVELAVLLSLVVAALYVSPFSHRAFEADKLFLVQTLALCGGMGLVALLWLRPRRPRLDPRLWPPYLQAAAAGLVSLLLATGVSLDRPTSFRGSFLRQEGLATEFSYLFLLVGAGLVFRSEERRRFAFTTLTVSSIPVCAYGLLQIGWPDLMHLPHSAVVRGASTMGSGLAVAAWAAPLLPLSLLQVLERRHSPTQRSVGGVAFALQVAAIAGSGSRGPALAVVLGALSAVALWGKVQGKSKLIGIASATALVVVLAGTWVARGASGNQKNVARLQHTFDFTHHSSRGRLATWKAFGEAFFADKPLKNTQRGEDRAFFARSLVGFGPETQGTVLPRYHGTDFSGVDADQQRVDRAHNVFWDRLFTQGVLGLTSFLFLWTLLSLQAVKLLGLEAPRRFKGLALGWVLPVTSLFGAVWAAQLFGLGLLGIGFGAGFVVGFLGWCLVSERTRPTQQVSFSTLLLLASVLIHWLELQVGVPFLGSRATFCVVAGVLLSGAVSPEAQKEGLSIGVREITWGTALGCLIATLCLGPVGGGLGEVLSVLSPIEVCLLVGATCLFLFQSWGKSFSLTSVVLACGAAALCSSASIVLGSSWGGDASPQIQTIAERLQQVPLWTSLALVFAVAAPVIYRSRRSSGLSLSTLVAFVFAAGVTTQRARPLEADVAFKFAESRLATIGNDAALRFFRQPVELAPDQDQYARRLVNRLYKKATSPTTQDVPMFMGEALERNKALMRARPFHIEPLLNQGRMLMTWASLPADQDARKARAKAAKKNLLRAAELAPELGAPYHFLGRYFLTVEDRPELALVCALIEDERSPQSPAKDWLLGLSSLKLAGLKSEPEASRLREQALKSYRRALRSSKVKFPQSRASVHVLVAQLSAQSGDLVDAEFHLKKAAREEPTKAGEFRSLLGKWSAEGIQGVEHGL